MTLRKGKPKTGGRQRGSHNRPKPLILADTEENRQLVLMAPSLVKEIKTPKMVMLEAMMRFDSLSMELMAKAKRMAKSGKSFGEIRDVLEESYRFTIAAVGCAEKAAPYIHARLLAIESRGDNVDPVAPFVLRAPSVIEDSDEWQAMVSQQGAVLAKAEREAVQEHLRERDATPLPPADENAPRATPTPANARLEGMPHPAMPSGLAETDVSPMPTPLRADPKTGRIIGPVEPTPAPSPRMMSATLGVVTPLGTAEWLESVARDRAKRTVGE